MDSQPGSSLTSDIADLLTDFDSADVEFTVGDEGECVYAHRTLLWARCERFKSMRREFWARSYSSHDRLQIQQPGCNVDVFRAVLAFIYTNEIHLTIDSLFDVMALAEELGVQDLESQCTTFLRESLSVKNSSWFLTLADQYHRHRQSERSRRRLDTCLRFVMENAEDVVATREFLDMSSSVVMQLVSSDHFALREEDVWRSMLRWAKHKAGVGTAVKKWTERDREKVGKKLAGIIHHIRFQQIDGRVYAEEIEPTGVIPADLDRRHLPAGQNQALRPRILIRLFQDSELLLKDHLPYQRLLNEWYGNPQQQWQLLHRASRDGFSSKSFHKNCDEHRPTFVVVLGSDGHLCGGFSDQPWKTNAASKSGGYAPSQRNFLFTLVNSAGVQPTRFSIRIHHYAIAYHTSCGPIFGGGADLCLSNNCNINMESYSNFPHSYFWDSVADADTPLASTSDLFMGKKHFAVKDYEVFTLKGAQLTFT